MVAIPPWGSGNLSRRVEIERLCVDRDRYARRAQDLRREADALESRIPVLDARIRKLQEEENEERREQD